VPEFGFPRTLRLRKRAEYLSLGSGEKVYLPHFLIVWKGGGSSPRFGITASRKTGVAVVRNRVKRLVREYLRLHPQIAANDYNIIARRGAGELTYHEVVRELDRGFALAASKKCRNAP
jgi:ribonuclease P protein component